MSGVADVAVSEEQVADVRGLPIAYQTFGDPSDEPLLLVMGLGGPMTWWDDRLCRQLAGAGFHVIRFDNRDIGHSGSVRGKVSMRLMITAFLGAPVTAPYSLVDMAEDAFGLLDHLGIESAHLCGISMGGMIVQTMAIEHPERVRSLVSIMSTTGSRLAGWQHPSILPMMLTRSRTREEYADSSVTMARLIGSPGFPIDEAETRARAVATWDRGIRAAGIGRQILAILTQPDRTKALGRLTMPTTVIHGLADRMVHVTGGRATSMAIPGAELLLIDGMGHDLPEPLWPTYVRAIRATADRAR